MWWWACVSGYFSDAGVGLESIAALSRAQGIHPMITGVLRLAWDTHLLTTGMGVGAADSDGASAVVFWEGSWEDGSAIAWPAATHRPPQTTPAMPPRARLAGVGGVTPRPALISLETSPQTLEVAAILARSGRSMKKIEEGVVSNRSLDPLPSPLPCSRHRPWCR